MLCKNKLNFCNNKQVFWIGFDWRFFKLLEQQPLSGDNKINKNFNQQNNPCKTHNLIVNGTFCDEVRTILNDVRSIRDGQNSSETILGAIQVDNKSLWRDVAVLRSQHHKQRRVIEKLIEFLLSLIKNRNNMVSKKRKIRLMINEGSPNQQSLMEVQSSESVSSSVCGEASGVMMGASPKHNHSRSFHSGSIDESSGIGGSLSSSGGSGMNLNAGAGYSSFGLTSGIGGGGRQMSVSPQNIIHLARSASVSSAGTTGSMVGSPLVAQQFVQTLCSGMADQVMSNVTSLNSNGINSNSSSAASTSQTGSLNDMNAMGAALSSSQEFQMGAREHQHQHSHQQQQHSHHNQHQQHHQQQQHQHHHQQQQQQPQQQQQQQYLNGLQQIQPANGFNQQVNGLMAGQVAGLSGLLSIQAAGLSGSESLLTSRSQANGGASSANNGGQNNNNNTNSNTNNNTNADDDRNNTNSNGYQQHYYYY